MLISIRPFLQKPIGLSWTENRIFFSRIQISVQFLGNLSYRQMLGGRVIRLRSFFKGSASGIKSATERGSRGVDGYQSWLVSVGAYNAFMASA